MELLYRGFVPYGSVVGGKIAYELAAEPKAPEVYTALLERYMQLQGQVLETLRAKRRK